ncbi:MAG: hypothetical protein KC466_06220, partial [Myxococcales bacterium]|nr:hypothetical protein [Myxococcales bacterium]
CDDGDACTTGDHCADGTCACTPNDANCDDGNPCTIDTCVDNGSCLAAFQVLRARGLDAGAVAKSNECQHTVDPDLCDEFCSSAAATISYLGMGPYEICLASGSFNANVMVEPGPYMTGVDINTEMVALELSGTAPALGTIRIYEDPDITSPGVITNVVASGGDFVSGDSSFDIYIRIDVLGGAVTLVPCDGSPIHMTSDGITTLPPFGSVYVSDFDIGETVPLCPVGSATVVGEFHHAQHEVCDEGQTVGSCP